VHLALGGSPSGSPAHAGRLLSRLLAEAEAQERWGRAIEVLALLALVRQAEGEGDRALDLLARALALAEPEGYVRTFLDAGAGLAGLLRALAGRDDVGRYAARLLAAFAPDAAGLAVPERGEAPGSSTPVPWDVEPLSDRELEVLRLVAAGLTNAQIADRLFIAVSTVKSHTNSIYGKLGVQNRTQAVARAQELSLL
jgi:LuxR family maltose regulon positive regulatory protein